MKLKKVIFRKLYNFYKQPFDGNQSMLNESKNGIIGPFIDLSHLSEFISNNSKNNRDGRYIECDNEQHG